MTPIPEQSYTFYVAGTGTMTECWLPVGADTTLGSIKSEMIEAGIRAAAYGTVLAVRPDGDIAQACLNRDGTIRWEMLRDAIREAQKGTKEDAIVGWLSNTSDITFDPFVDEYVGCWDSLADYAEDQAVDSGELAQVPERLRDFIDWERVGRKLISDCSIWTRETVDGCHIFRS